MRPDDVGKVLGEVRILRRGQPLGEHLATILASDIWHFSAEELGFHHFFGDGVAHVAAAGVEDDAFAWVFGIFATDLREERGEAVVVIHRPAIKGMVVALGALHAHAHENLSDVLADLERLLLDLVVVGRGVGERAAGGAEKLLHDLVHRHVVR